MLKITPSKLIPSEASIQTAKTWLATASTWREQHQFRAHGFRADGSRVQGAHYQAMCSGSLNVGGYYFQGDTLAVCYLGEFNGGHHSSRTFKFTDDRPDSDGHLWLSYLLGPESPYVQLHPFLTTTDPEETYRQRGFIFHGMDTMPIGLFKCFVIAMRMVGEYPNAFLVWKKLVERGCNPRAAHCVAVPYRYLGKDRYKDDLLMHSIPKEAELYYAPTGSHASFDNPMLSYWGAIRQTYIGSSLTCRGGARIPGAFHADGFSRGFDKSHTEVYRFLPRRYFDNLMNSSIYDQRLCSGRSYATLEDLANQANLITLIATEALDEKEGNALLDKLWDDVKVRQAATLQVSVARPKISLNAA